MWDYFHNICSVCRPCLSDETQNRGSESIAKRLRFFKLKLNILLHPTSVAYKKLLSNIWKDIVLFVVEWVSHILFIPSHNSTGNFVLTWNIDRLYSKFFTWKTNEISNTQGIFREYRHLHVCALWRLSLTICQDQEYFGYNFTMLTKSQKIQICIFFNSFMPTIRVCY